MAIKIEFASDVSQVIKGTDSIADALDDAARMLDALAKDGVTTGGRLEKSLDGAADAAGDLGKVRVDRLGDGLEATGKDAKTLESKLKDAQDGAAKLGTEGKSAFSKLADEARSAGKTAGDSTKAGMEHGGEAVETFKDEAKSNLSEVASSFSGSMDSAVDLVQGTLGGIVADLGPAGLLGGALAAVGIGLAKAFAEGEAERINKIGESVTDLATRLREADGDMSKVDIRQVMEDWGLAIQDNREWWELWQDTAKTGVKKVADQARDAGVNFSEAFRGTKGTLEESKVALDQVNRALAVVTASAEKYTDAQTGVEHYVNTGDQQRIQALKDLKQGYEDNIKTHQDATEANRLLESAGVKTAASIEREQAAAQKADDALQGMADTLRDAANANMDADKAQLDYTKTLNQGAADIKANGRSMDENTAAGQANRQTLLDIAGAANTVIQAQVNQGASTDVVKAKAQEARESFIKQAMAAGATADQAQDLANRYGLIPDNVDTWVKAHDVEKTKKEIDGVAAPRNAPINLVRGTEEVTRWIQGMNGQRVYVDIAPKGGVGITN